MFFDLLKNNIYFIIFILFLSCKSLDILEFKEIEKFLSIKLPNTKIIIEGEKISLRYYFNIFSKFNLRYKEPLFIKIKNEIVGIFLFRKYKKVNDFYIQTFFSVGSDISFNVYLKLLKSRLFYIVDVSGRIIKEFFN